MKTQSFFFSITLVPAFVLFTGLGSPLPLFAQNKAVYVDPSTNVLTQPSATQLYAANPVPWSSIAGVPATLAQTDQAQTWTATQTIFGASFALSGGNFQITGTDNVFAVGEDVIFKRGSVDTGTVVSNAFLRFDGAGKAIILSNGSDGEVLTISSGVPTWGAAPDGAGFGVLTPTPPTDTNLAVDLADNSLIEIDTASATGDITLALSNATPGKTYKFKITQGATARSLVFPANTLSASSGNVVAASEASAVDLVYAEYTGSQWLIGPRVDGLSGPDVDTEAYLSAIAAVDGSTLSAADQAVLDGIVRGMKARGYWATSRAFIASSNYNVSTGNTVYAFGGLTTANFTKTGTVALASGGLVMNGTTESVTAPDFLPGGPALTVVYSGNVFGNASNSLIWSHYEAANDQRSAAIRVAQSDSDRIEFLLSQNGTTADAQFDFPPTTVDHIANANQIISMVFDTGDLKAWSDDTVIFDATLDDVTSLHDSTADVIAHGSTASGTLVFFLVSTSAWLEADLAWLRGELANLNLN